MLPPDLGNFDKVATPKKQVRFNDWDLSEINRESEKELNRYLNQQKEQGQSVYNLQPEMEENLVEIPTEQELDRFEQ